MLILPGGGTYVIHPSNDEKATSSNCLVAESPNTHSRMGGAGSKTKKTGIKPPTKADDTPTLLLLGS